MHRRKIKRYGWRPDLPDFRDFVHRPATAPEETEIDWRPDPAMPPVYNQLDLGSCTGNGEAGTAAFAIAAEGHPPIDATGTPSRLFLYYNSRAAEGDVGDDSGAQIRDGLATMATLGMCGESLWPYDISKFAVQPPANCYADALAHKIVQYARVPQRQADFEAALAAKRLIVFGFTVYESFESAVVATSGMMPMPAPTESVLGGHCVVAVGYKRPEALVICRNSWGADWGDKGYFYMPYDYFLSSLASDFWTISSVA